MLVLVLRLGLSLLGLGLVWGVSIMDWFNFIFRVKVRFRVTFSC